METTTCLRGGRCGESSQAGLDDLDRREAGVSCFDILDCGPGYIVFLGVLGDDRYLQDEIFLAIGEEVGRGMDDEPLLRGVTLRPVPEGTRLFRRANWDAQSIEIGRVRGGRIKTGWTGSQY